MLLLFPRHDTRGIVTNGQAHMKGWNAIREASFDICCRILEHPMRTATGDSLSKLLKSKQVRLVGLYNESLNDQVPDGVSGIYDT